jgi:cysteinyl-tRNA synthetase
MTDLLHYDVVLCQNITDIDDKIIIRSSEQGVPFSDLSRRFETEFNEDMALLGVAPPDMVTRVSEYIGEIVDYIDVLVKKGFAYESNGSVYFDIAAFEAAGYRAGKLMPEQKGNSELLAEGEGALCAKGDKKSASDFALWKKTKGAEGIVEPSWASPWGQGRPGWHIECSVMSSCALEKLNGRGYSGLDVHAGGVDLKFPHHDNEVIQSEAYLGSHQWVNYWLHTGHLNIKGLKMSKSLKNFITIRQALEVHTSRQIRWCFLLHKYNAPMDYSDSTMTHAVAIDKIFSEFFLNAKAALRRCSPSDSQRVGDREFALLAGLERCRGAVRGSLLDDFDVPGAISSLLELVRDCNRYLEEGALCSSTLTAAAKYLTATLRTLGLTGDADIGFALERGTSSGASKEELLTPYLNVLTKFREAVRLSAIAADSKAILEAADALRDEVLPELGVRMEDKGSGKDVVTIWKLDDPAALRKEKALKEQQRAEKLAAKEDAAKKLAAKEAQARIPPEELFRGRSDLYSAFDAAGLPTHDDKGEPLTKGASKKLQKELEKQREVHDKWQLGNSSTTNPSSN